MLKDGEVVGAIVIYRQEVRTFNDREIELLKSFAAQAVIAIENARLLNELRKSLQQQTATADVLRVIRSSPGDLELMFDSMLEHAARIRCAELRKQVPMGWRTPSSYCERHNSIRQHRPDTCRRFTASSGAERPFSIAC